MHRDFVTLTACTPGTDFFITASNDGHLKFWKKRFEVSLRLGTRGVEPPARLARKYRRPSVMPRRANSAHACGEPGLGLGAVSIVEDLNGLRLFGKDWAPKLKKRFTIALLAAHPAPGTSKASTNDMCSLLRTRCQQGIEFVKHFRSHMGPILGLAVSADGHCCATIGQDKAGGLLRTSTQPAMNLLLLLRGVY